MKTSERDGLDTVGRRRRDRATLAKVSPLPPPEEVFADWLVSVQPNACLEAAARNQIEMIDRSAVALHPSVQQLRLLLLAVADDSVRRRQDDVSDR
ncbi:MULTISPECIES: hypothetical protein [unclassified Aminobacter]|uniref:hypothetical protein n=1 Tax=unclassified Aminobacter TaxID=2644704 RepID=UPI0011A94EEE|nr:MULTISPECIES: hypothetical protein [unclassified Aminobacter]